MSEKPKSTFARRGRAAKPRAGKYEIRDDMVTGLGLAVQPTGVRTFVFNRMMRGRRRYATIDNADAMTVPEARAEARKLIAAFLDTVKNDSAPRTPGQPMDAFAVEFLDRQAWHWKPRTRETNAYLVRKYTLPAFGIWPWTRSPSSMSRTDSPAWPPGPAPPTARSRSCPP